MYVSKIASYTKFIGIGEVVDLVLMQNCPTQSEFALVDEMY